ELSLAEVVSNLPQDLGVDDRLYAFTVPHTDPREGLRGGIGVAASQRIEEHTVLGTYSGYLACDDEVHNFYRWSESALLKLVLDEVEAPTSNPEKVHRLLDKILVLNDQLGLDVESKLGSLSCLPAGHASRSGIIQELRQLLLLSLTRIEQRHGLQLLDYCLKEAGDDPELRQQVQAILNGVDGQEHRVKISRQLWNLETNAYGLDLPDDYNWDPKPKCPCLGNGRNLCCGPAPQPHGPHQRPSGARQGMGKHRKNIPPIQGQREGSRVQPAGRALCCDVHHGSHRPGHPPAPSSLTTTRPKQRSASQHGARAQVFLRLRVLQELGGEPGGCQRLEGVLFVGENGVCN
ncbi:hypothetical protein HaLaN_24065, partial [Haematococcus lacustris]